MNTPENRADAGSAGEGGQDTTNMPAEGNSISLSAMAETHAKNYDGFDPTIHATNEDGTPKLKSDGTYAKKRGRKAGKGEPLPDIASENRVENLPLESAPIQPERPKISAEAAARQAANWFIGMGVMVFGKEWEPESKDEAQGLKLAFKDYFDASGTPDIPPGVALVAALGAYGFQRFQHENTQSKIQKAWFWIKAKISGKL